MIDLTAPGTLPLLGGLLGLVCGLGLCLALSRLPGLRQPTLEDRVAPYLRDTAVPSRLLTRHEPLAFPGPARILTPVIADLGRQIERILGGAPSVRRRLQRAGRVPSVERFRAEQVIWGAIGGGIGVAIGAFGLVARRTSAVTFVMLVLVCVVSGVVLRDVILTRSAVRREQRMMLEFPTVAELLALAVGAGEGAAGALERVCRLSSGDLAAELRVCLAESRSGASLPSALQGLADRTGLVSLSRFVDGIIVAVERGTPLADVLRAQAQDVREEGRRAVMEEGGRKEIAMMVPVVFLVLPVTILFALYPGLAFLRLSV